MTTTWFGDGDDEDDKTEQKGGPDAGNYEPPKNLPIPGEGDPVDNSHPASSGLRRDHSASFIRS